MYALCAVKARSGMSRYPFSYPPPPPSAEGEGVRGPYLARKLDHYEMEMGV
jgi:hypothetical protein